MKIIDFRHELLPLKDKMFRLALRITLNRAEAEDVTQDILLRVWEQRESLGELRSLEAYVLTAVRNLALDRVAKTDNANVSLDDVQTDAFDSAPRPLWRVLERFYWKCRPWLARQLTGRPSGLQRALTRDG